MSDIERLLLLVCYSVLLSLMWLRPAAEQQLSSLQRFRPTTFAWGLHNSYSVAHSNYVDQYYSGVRLFEIDVYWWLQHTWIVSHIPLLTPPAHIVSLSKTVCQLRRLGNDNVLFLDIKNMVWPSCGDFAVDRLRSELASCASDGPLTALIDVTCGTYFYDNTECARKLRGVNITNTTVLLGNMDFHWLVIHSPDLNPTTSSRQCAEFSSATTPPHAPALVECCDSCTRQLCIERAIHSRFNVQWLQFRN